MIIHMAYQTILLFILCTMSRLRKNFFVLIRIIKLLTFQIFYSSFIMELSLLDGYWVRVRVLTTNWYEPKL
jgi:hypothetical protein